MFELHLLEDILSLQCEGEENKNKAVKCHEKLSATRAVFLS